MTAFPMHLVRDDLRDFGGYASARSSDSGAPATIWLNANEAASASTVDPDGGQRRYPDPQPAELVAALATTAGTTGPSLNQVSADRSMLAAQHWNCTASCSKVRSPNSSSSGRTPEVTTRCSSATPSG